MRVLLVQSWLGGDGPPVFPIGLACLAAALPGHEVRAFDPNVSPDPLPGLVRLIDEFSPDVVGLSLRNIDSTNTRVNVSYYRPFKRLLHAVRAATAAPVVVGGSGFSMYAQRIMEDCPEIACGVFLEGEETFAALLTHLDEPLAVPSVYARRNGTLAFSGPSPAKACLDDLPAPDFSILPMAPYTVAPWGVGVETKRGCAMHCLYCPYGFLNGRAYRRKAPERVAEELWTLEHVHRVPRFTFLDSIWSFPRDHAAAVCRAMIARGVRLPWSAWFSEQGLDRDFLTLCAEAGCDTVIFSPDAFGDAALERLGKASRVADIKAAYRLVRDMGRFEVSYNFFKNPPGQTLAAFLAMLGFVVTARVQMGRRAHFEFNTLRVEPHTGLARLAVSEGVVAPDADLLEPVFYGQKKTALLEKAFNLALRLAGK